MGFLHNGIASLTSSSYGSNSILHHPSQFESTASHMKEMLFPIITSTRATATAATLNTQLYSHADILTHAMDDSSSSMVMSQFTQPLMLSFLAGASTCIGAAIVFVIPPHKMERYMSFSLSLAASVMITVSVVSLGVECLENVVRLSTTSTSSSSSFEIPTIEIINASLLFQRISCFLTGCLGYWLLSKAMSNIPEPETLLFGESKEHEPGNAHDDLHSYSMRDYHSPVKYHPPMLRTQPPIQHTNPSDYSPMNMLYVSAPMLESSSDWGRIRRIDEQNGGDPMDLDMISTVEADRRSWRVAMLLFVSLLLHNFPEGLAVAASTVESSKLGVTVASGIMIHNIPEGIAIAIPCVAASKNPWLAFGLASASGLAEPIGATIALLWITHYSTSMNGMGSTAEPIPLDNVLSCVAGIMCMVATFELYPESLRHLPKQANGNSISNMSDIILGTVCGVAIMLATELYLEV